MAHSQAEVASVAKSYGNISRYIICRIIHQLELKIKKGNKIETFKL